MQQQIWRVDLHAHTWYSADAINSPKRLIRRARAVGLNRIAVTDHGSFAGAREAAAIDPELIIPGEEMKCVGGAHLIGLFLSEEIPDGLSVEVTAARIREQGGIVYAPHPFAYLRHAAERAEAALAVADIAEVFNARAFIPSWNRRAEQAISQLALPRAAGTDAHTPFEIGRAYMEMPAFTDADSFRAAMVHARPGKTQLSSVFLHTFSITSEVIRRATGRGHGVSPWPTK